MVIVEKPTVNDDHDDHEVWFWK